MDILDDESNSGSYNTPLDYMSVVSAMAGVVDARDRFTADHSRRVAAISFSLASQLGMSPVKCKALYRAALLHDLGKISVPDSLLNKPDKLTDVEFSIIKQHTIVGYDILSRLPDVPYVCDVALYHHERYGGGGYPTGISGELIPESARIVAIADAYDAMSSDRVYRKSLAMDDIIAQFNRYSGIQFDPNFAEVFVDMLKSGFSIVESLKSVGDIELGNIETTYDHLYDFVNNSDITSVAVAPNSSLSATCENTISVNSPLSTIASVPTHADADDFISILNEYDCLNEALNNQNKHSIDLFVISIENNGVPIEELSRVRKCMAFAIHQTISRLDLWACAKDNKFIVMLLDHDASSNIDLTVERIFLRFYSIYGASVVKLDFSEITKSAVSEILVR